MLRVINVTGLRGEARKGIVYVGRKFAGWPAHRLGNPFRPLEGDAPGTCLDKYRRWLEGQRDLPRLMERLWQETMEGQLPLGCWCTTATAGDGSPVVCHAQILAEMLRVRFIEAK